MLCTRQASRYTLMGRTSRRHSTPLRLALNWPRAKFEDGDIRWWKAHWESLPKAPSVDSEKPFVPVASTFGWKLTNDSYRPCIGFTLVEGYDLYLLYARARHSCRYESAPHGAFLKLRRSNFDAVTFFQKFG